MNKVVIAGLVAGVLIAGFIFSPLIKGPSPIQAQAQASTGKTKHVTLIASEIPVKVAPDNALHPGGIMYNAMVFNGTIPGPVIAVDQGDTLNITLVNKGKVIHSLDFHAAIGPSQVLSGNVDPGKSKSWTLKANSAGAFFYHCGADALNGVWEHIANGMYGALIVHPENEKPAKEFYVVFSDLYNSADQGPFNGTHGKTGSFDLKKFINQQPDLILTNGMAHKYVPAVGQQVKLTLNPDAEVFKVKPGELTRWYIVAAGPNEGVSFHFIAGQIDVHDGFIKNRLMSPEMNEETWWVPVGSASVFESVFPEKGLYVGVDHNMAHVVKGAAFAVMATNASTPTDQPKGTAVPPKGSTSAANEASTGMAVNASQPTQNVNPVMKNETLSIKVNGTSSSANKTMTASSPMSATANKTMSKTANATMTSASGGNSVSIVSGASTMTDTAFSPNPVNVKVGDTVTWTNNDSQLHTVTSGTGPSDPQMGKQFDSGLTGASVLGPGKTFSHTFTTAGTFSYFCQLHPAMVGKVIVS